MTNLDSTLKCRDITFSTKVDLVKTMVFPVVMYGCKSWTIKKAEHRCFIFNNWCFWTVVLEKTLESPSDYGDPIVHPWGNKSWVFIGRADVEAENFNTLATRCGELTHLKRPWSWERLRAGGEGGDGGWDGWMVSSTQWTWLWLDSGSWWWTARPWCAAVHEVTKSWTHGATELNYLVVISNC